MSAKTKQAKIAGAAKHRTAQTIDNFRLLKITANSSTRCGCVVCRRITPLGCVYIQRFGLCAVCLDNQIWRDEQRRYAANIILREVNR